MSPRKDHALAAAAIVFALAAVWIFWPIAPAPPGQRPSSPPPVSVSPRPPLPASASAAQDDVADQIAAGREETAAALRLHASPARREKLNSLDAQLLQIETKLEPTSLAAVEVLELRQQIGLELRPAPTVRRELREWLVARAVPPADPKTWSKPAWGRAGRDIITRIYQRHIDPLQAATDKVSALPFSEEKLARFEPVLHQAQDLSQEPDIPALLAAKAHKLVSDLYAKQALYPESQAAFRAYVDSHEQADGAEATDSLLRRKADLLAGRHRKYDDAVFLYGLLLERLTAESGRKWYEGTLRLGGVLDRQARHAQAIAVYEAIVAATDDPRWKAKAYLGMGRAAKHARQYATAIARYQAVRDADNTTEVAAYAYVDAALCVWNLNRPEQTTRMLARFPSLYPWSRYNNWAKIALRECREALDEGIYDLTHQLPSDGLRLTMAW